jgi:orotidine-5'-phosphate decarboxylase
MKFKKKLLSAAVKNNSWLCVGLDPDPAKIPDEFGKGVSAMAGFCSAVIEATRDLVCAYKPNAAFFEALGPAGWEALIECVRTVPNNIPVILDCKRGDIGNTAQMYAKSAFEIVGADAVTLSPYLGKDSVEPFLKYNDKGSFVLCLTSNPSNADLQKKFILLDEPPSELNLAPQSKAKTNTEFPIVFTSELYLYIAKLIMQWNGNDNIGLVVGATSPSELEKVRKIVGEEIPILIPGVGSQGGDLEKSVISGSNSAGQLAIINISRAIIYPEKRIDFNAGVRQAAESYRDKIAKIIDKKAGHKP